MRTETLTVVFTDIKGYTATTSKQSHQENAEMLRRVGRLVEPVVKAFTGRFIKSIGDAYMITFASPTQAVRCAMAVQDRLASYNQGVKQNSTLTPLHLRIALNIGEVRVHRGDVFGEPVNIAARIESVTPADEIYFSEAIYLTMNRSDLFAERVGEYEFKGIPELVTVYRAKKAGGEETSSEGLVAALAPTETGVEPKAEAASIAQPLPFGGRQLSHFESMHRLRRAYLGLWVIAALGFVGAAYLRYRPQTDYSEVVAQAKNALEQGKPVDALALTGQIPAAATFERSAARRYRRQAVALLLGSGDVRSARTEIDALLTEDPRDSEALLLRGELLAKRPEDIKDAVAALTLAFRLNPSLGQRPDAAAAVVEAYADPQNRHPADLLVEAYVRQAAIPALNRALNNPNFDRSSKNTLAQRLEKLGAGQDIDWVALALEDLKSTSCKTRKTAINRLVGEGDERAVGPLLKLSETRSCVSVAAKKAVDTLLGH